MSYASGYLPLATALLERETAQTLGGEPAAHLEITASSWQAGLLSQVRVTFPRQALYASLTGTQMANRISVQHTLRASE